MPENVVRNIFLNLQREDEMKVIFKPKEAGKTYDIIKHCAKHGGYIVCRDYTHCKRIFEMSQEMNVNIPFPLTFHEVMSKYYGRGCNRFYKDDADEFLRVLFPDVEIKSISITGTPPPKDNGQRTAQKKQQLKGKSVPHVKGKIRDI